MRRYSSPILDKLFLKLGKAAIHFKNFGLNEFPAPTIGIESIDILTQKYVDFILQGLSPDFIKIEMEMDKLYFDKTSKLNTMCLLIIQQAIFKLVGAASDEEFGLEYIVGLAKHYTGYIIEDTLRAMDRHFSGSENHSFKENNENTVYIDLISIKTFQ